MEKETLRYADEVLSIDALEGLLPYRFSGLCQIVKAPEISWMQVKMNPSSMLINVNASLKLI